MGRESGSGGRVKRRHRCSPALSTPPLPSLPPCLVGALPRGVGLAGAPLPLFGAGWGARLAAVTTRAREGAVTRCMVCLSKQQVRAGAGWRPSSVTACRRPLRLPRPPTRSHDPTACTCSLQERAQLRGSASGEHECRARRRLVGVGRVGDGTKACTWLQGWLGNEKRGLSGMCGKGMWQRVW